MPHRPSSGPARGPSQRQLRVGEMLRHELSEILRDRFIRDSDLEGVSVTVTEVRPSPDMRHAAIFCAPLGGKNAKTVVDALNRHRGYLRGELGRRITMKFTPDLRFMEDQSFVEADRITNLLNSDRVARDILAPPKTGPKSEADPKAKSDPAAEDE